MKQLFRTKLITGVIIGALILYAVVRLLTLQGDIAAVNERRNEARRNVAEMELGNAKLEHDTGNHDQPDVQVGIAQTYLGYAFQDEVIFDDGLGEFLDDD